MAPHRIATDSPTIALQVLDALREIGVDVVFGIPGGAISAIYAALLERPDVKNITAKHESGAGFMAVGYAIATGRPGVVITTAGPGITNAMTGVASAMYEGVPLVHVAGEVARSSFGRGALQEGSAHALDTVALAQRFTKFSAQISRPESAEPLVRKALSIATSGRRGPVFLSLPMDVAAAPAAPQSMRGNVRSVFDVDRSSCRRAMELLGEARRPLILAGAGARDASSRRALRELAEHLVAPVAVTTKGKGTFPEDHPLYLGLFGFGGHDSVTNYLSGGVDVLLVAGTGLNDFATNAWSPVLRASRAFIQIDIDPAQLGKNYAIDFGLLGPMDAVMSRMLEHAPKEMPRREISWNGPTYQPSEPRAGAITTADVMHALNDTCPSDSVFTADMGEHLAFALHYLKVRAGSEFLALLGLGSMGSGICSAIGYQLGAPARRTYAICGDGGMLMFGSELATAVQHGICTTFIVINDSRLNMVHHGMRELYGATPDFSTQLIDFAAMAKSFGAQGTVIRTRSELVEALREPPRSPLVLDVRIDPDVRLSDSQRNVALRQFKGGPYA